MAERKRIAVPISGIDTSTPDHSVTDGKCEVLNNLRYTGGAWRNVKGLETIVSSIPTEIDSYTNIQLVYKHPEDVEDAYICTAKLSGNLVLARLLIEDNTLDIICLLDSKKEYEYNHFGKIFSVGNNTDKSFTYYHLYQDKYTQINTSGMLATLSCDLGEATRSAQVVETGIYNSIHECIYSNAAISTTMSSTQSNLWRGEIAMFVTIEAEGLGELSKSAPIIINTAQANVESFTGDYGWVWAMQQLSAKYPKMENAHTIEVNKNDDGTTTINVVADNLLEWYNLSGQDQEVRLDLIKKGLPYMRFYSPTLKISLNDIIQAGSRSSNIPYKIKVWTTRIYPMFDINKLIESAYIDDSNLLVKAKDLHGYFNDSHLFSEPFYLLQTLYINDFEKNGDTLQKSINISSNDLTTVIHNTLYETSIGYSSLYSNKILEYNNRWYLAAPYANIDTSILQEINTSSDVSDYKDIVLETSTDENLSYTKYAPMASKYFLKEQDILLAAPLYSTNILFTNQNGNTTSSFPLTMSSSLGIAVYINRASRALLNTSGEPEKAAIGSKPYANIMLDAHEYGYRPNIKLEGNPLQQQTNRVQVSTLNSNLSFAFENSYRIGTRANEIIAMNSAALEMSDAKFGEFPIYLFTKEGIYAMQLGNDVLHPNIPAINNDVVINPNTLAVNNAVLYFTERGLHALSKSGRQLISAPIHLANNRIPDWMYTTQMVYLPEWNEVLCTDLLKGKAYIYSLSTNVWSSRDIPIGNIISKKLLVGNNAVYNLQNEMESFASIAQMSMQSYASETYRHTWESNWGILDTNTNGVSSNYTTFTGDNTLYAYQAANLDYFKDLNLYRDVPPTTLNVTLDKVCLVSTTNPLFQYEDVDELLIIHEESGAILGYASIQDTGSSNTQGGRDYWSAYYMFPEHNDTSVEGYMMTFGDKKTINGKTYYVWLSEANQSENEELRTWLESHNFTFEINGGAEAYIGDYTDLYYVFNEPLQPESTQPTPQIYCSSDGHIYKSDIWEDAVIYSRALIESGEEDDNEGDNGGGDSGEEGGGNEGDNGVGIPFSLTTRPIKLGSMELKRAETIIVRFECATEQTLNVKIEGSIDTQNWGELRNLKGVQTNKDIVIRRTPCSVKYLRFTIEGSATDDIRILAFELEYYERMRHRMR